MHENFHNNLNENIFSFTFLCNFFLIFYGGQLKQQICYSFTLIISYMVFNSGPVLVFPIWWSKCFISSNSTGPWPRLQRGRNIPGMRFFVTMCMCDKRGKGRGVILVSVSEWINLLYPCSVTNDYCMLFNNNLWLLKAAYSVTMTFFEKFNFLFKSFVKV